MRFHPSSLFLGNGRRVAEHLRGLHFGATLRDMANDLELPRDKVEKLLRRLAAMGAVTRDERDAWHVTAPGRAALAAWEWLMEQAVIRE